MLKHRNKHTTPANKATTDSSDRPVVDKQPYYFSPSFVTHKGKVASIVQLYVRAGTNRSMHLDDVVDIIPIAAMKNVVMYTIIDDTLVKDADKKKLIIENAAGGRDVINDTIANGNKHETDAASTIIKQHAELEDYDDYEVDVDSPTPIVAFRIRLLIVADTREQIDTQIRVLNLALDKAHPGAMWDSLGGEQYDWFTSQLATSYTGSRFDMTSTGSNYAKLNFTTSLGVQDPRGVPVGTDVMSLTLSTSFVDFDSFLKRQAIIAIPRVSEPISEYASADGLYVPSCASLTAQLAANQICMNGHRVHHIVLNDFDYTKPNVYYRPKETLDIIKQYDVARMTINPLEGFGQISEVAAVYNRLIQKIVNIFNVLEDLQLTQDDKAIILNACQRFYFNHDLWTTSAEKYAKRTRIVNIDNHETYPTLGMFINEFLSLAADAARANRELKADKIDTLYAILEQSLTANMSVLGRPTSIQPLTQDTLQTYYSFDNLPTTKIKQVQFLNIIDYVIFTAKPGDVIIIHSMERLYASTATAVREAITAAQKRGIRFIFTFDTLTSQQTSVVDTQFDMFNARGVYYTDLDYDVDYSIIGRCLPSEVDKLADALNTQLPPTVEQQLVRKTTNQVMIHRHADDINNFTQLNMIV